MIPGLGSSVEARLLGLLDRSVTDLYEDGFADREFVMLDAHEPDAKRLGIRCSTSQGLTVVVTDRDRKLGDIRIAVGGQNCLLFFDNVTWGGNCHADIRVLGSDSVIFFNDIGDGYVALPDVFMRSDGQILYWGRASTAVGLSIELEGAGQGVLIGDDALVSSGVWIRNYDMHAIHDLRTGKRINRPPVDTILERHVWLGQDALLLGCERIGMGSIIGARSLVKDRVPARVAAAGIPARIIREEVSWGRDTYRMVGDERRALGLRETVPGTADPISG
jgi:acetyltransferase-like isoleucine patch superfamily enzyme